ncbi:MAG: hypothetical protein N5P05_001595 [Chroococcopsis gigantea SAG 12.99]|jgi:hypothetical protein|nr:hypothetical protein [Chroococcopsis gigantea SAG 12.99]
MKNSFIPKLITTVGLLSLLNACTTTEQKSATTSPSPTVATSPAQTTTATNTASGAPTESPVATNSPAASPSLEAKTDFDPTRAAHLTDTARLLAGLKLDDKSSFANVQKTNAWLNHRSFLNNSWSQLDSQQLSKVRKWGETELASINSSSPNVFYPFSGPDFLYAYSLFPNAKEIVMVGLEPVGKIPDFSELSELQRNQKLLEARNSLYAILKFSFFRTNDMKVDLAQQGVIPVLFLFMARTNNKILDAQYVGINKEGQIEKFAKGMIPGVRINFLPQGETTPRTLYYFSTDLSNDGLAKNPAFAQYVKSIDKPVTYLKAASYLMHYDNFSKVKNLILAQSSHLLQDDSGMPLKSIPKDQWDLNFYGVYNGPISLFSNFYQSDLKAAYSKDKDKKPLNFGIGYRFGVNDSNLMLANRK